MTAAQREHLADLHRRHGAPGEEHLYAAMRAFVRNDREEEERQRKLAYHHFTELERLLQEGRP